MMLSLTLVSNCIYWFYRDDTKTAHVSVYGTLATPINQWTSAHWTSDRLCVFICLLMSEKLQAASIVRECNIRDVMCCEKLLLYLGSKFIWAMDKAGPVHVTAVYEGRSLSDNWVTGAVVYNFSLITGAVVYNFSSQLQFQAKTSHVTHTNSQERVQRQQVCKCTVITSD